jgi:hypothetical protein
VGVVFLQYLFAQALRAFGHGPPGDLSDRMIGYFCERSELLVSFFSKIEPQKIETQISTLDSFVRS